VSGCAPQEDLRMAARYPSFSRVKDQVWAGEITPLTGVADQNIRVISALSRDHTVYVSENGTLDAVGQAHQSCLVPFRCCMNGLGGLRPRYRVIVGFFSPPPAHPCAYVIDPEISLRRYPRHPHLNPDGTLCVLFPPDGAWVQSRDGMDLYLDYVAIWLAKHAVYHYLLLFGFEERGWLGSEAPHGPDGVRQTHQGEQCPCGSGQPVEECCLPRVTREGHLLPPRRPTIKGIRRLLDDTAS